MPAEKQQQRARVLITGFGAFPDNPVNPSEALVRKLGIEFANRADIELRGNILTTAFNSAYKELRQEIARFSPDLVLAFGVRAGGKEFDIESTARNALGRSRDAEGKRHEPGPIEPGAPQTLRSTLPLRALREALRKADLPARVSKSAGKYVCNFLFYSLMRENTHRMAGFIHIPYSVEAAGHYTGKKQLSPLPEATLQKGAALIIETAVHNWRRMPQYGKGSL